MAIIESVTGNCFDILLSNEERRIMKHATFLAASLVSAGLIASIANAAPPESSTQSTTNAAPSTSTPATSATLNRQGGSAMNFASPDYVPPPPGLSGSPGFAPNGSNNALTPNGNSNAQNPNGSNNAQAPNGGNGALSPNGATNAPSPGGSSPAAVPTTIN
jgi:hypothetical protein